MTTTIADLDALSERVYKRRIGPSPHVPWAEVSQYQRQQWTATVSAVLAELDTIEAAKIAKGQA